MTWDILNLQFTGNGSRYCTRLSNHSALHIIIARQKADTFLLHVTEVRRFATKNSLCVPRLQGFSLKSSHDRMKRKDRSSTSAKEERKSKKTKKVSEVEEIQQVSKLDFSTPEKLFSSLVAPTTSEAFFADYWEKQPLLIKREDTSFYGPLFTKDDLEDILKKEELSFAEDVNVVRYEDGDKLYMNGDPEERVTWSQVNKDVKERHATVQFHQPQRFKVRFSVFFICRFAFCCGCSHCAS